MIRMIIGFLIMSLIAFNDALIFEPHLLVIYLAAMAVCLWGLVKVIKSAD